MLISIVQRHYFDGTVKLAVIFVSPIMCGDIRKMFEMLLHQGISHTLTTNTLV